MRRTSRDENRRDSRSSAPQKASTRNRTASETSSSRRRTSETSSARRRTTAPQNAGNYKNSSALQQSKDLQPGGFQLFDLREARAEEAEAEERARALEREEAERKAAALQRRMAKMEASYIQKMQTKPVMEPTVQAVETPVVNLQPVEPIKAKPIQPIQAEQTEPIQAVQAEPVQQVQTEPIQLIQTESERNVVKKTRQSAEQKQTKLRRKAADPVRKVRRPVEASATKVSRPETETKVPVEPVKPVKPVRRSQSSYNPAVLTKTLDSSRNFSSVHNAARKIQTENSSKHSAPKAELKNMDLFWAEMESAKKREEEERRQREIERARRMELEKARLQEQELAKLREAEIQKRREEEEERQRQLEIQKQNEEAAKRWKEAEAARIREEAERMREIQAQKRREEEAIRIQEREVAKIREAEVTRVQKEEEERIRQELARLQREDTQQIQIENMLEIEAAKYEAEGAQLREADQEELRKIEEEQRLQREEAIRNVPEKELDPLDDISFEEEDENSSENIEIIELDHYEEDKEGDPLPAEESADTITLSLDTLPLGDDTDFDDLAFDDIDEDFDDPAFDDIDEDFDDTAFDDIDEDFGESASDDADQDLDRSEYDDPEEESDATSEDEDFDEDEDDDFDEEIVPVKKNTSGKGFILPSFGKILESEKPREDRKQRILSEEVDKKEEVDTVEEVAEEEEFSATPDAVIQDTEIQDIEIQDIEISMENADSETIDGEIETDPDIDTEEYADTASTYKTAEKPETNASSPAIPIFANRKKYDAMLGKVVAGLLIGCMAVNAVLPDKQTSELENRELKQAPDLNVVSIADGSFTNGVESWQADQFVGRNGLRSLQIFLRWLGGDREENGVYLGRSGQLLESIVKPEEEQLKNTVAALNAFADTYPDKNFSMMLVPDAGTILSGSYPAFAERCDQRGYFGKVSSMLSDRYQWIDTLGALEPHSNEKLYYKTDHHWTSLGAYYGYQKYCETKGLEPGEFTPNAITNTFNGVLSSTSGFCMGEKEIIEMYVPASQTKCLVTYPDEQRQTASLYDKEKLNSKDQYGVFLGGNYPLVDIKTTTDNEKVLLLFKDSFANSMIPFLATQYKEIVVVDPRYYYGDAQELMLSYGVTDVVFLYSGNTFFADTNMQGLLSWE